MKHIIATLALAALTACSGTPGNDTPAAPEETTSESAAPEKGASDDTAPANAAPGKVTPEKAAPENAPPTPPDIPRLTALAFGGVNGSTPLDEAAIKAALPGFEIERTTFEAEGDTYVNYAVKLGGKQLVTVDEGMHGVSVSVAHPAVRDANGIGLGSTYARFKAAWPDATCAVFELKERVDGVDPFSTVDCRLPAAPALWYRFDITDLGHTGTKLPADTKIADRMVSTFKADYPSKANSPR